MADRNRLLTVTSVAVTGIELEDGIIDVFDFNLLKSFSDNIFIWHSLNICFAINDK